MLNWLTSVVDEDLKDPPSELWHYTDAGGLQGILHADRLWATNTRFLNDSQEISYGIHMATEAMREHRFGGLRRETTHFLAGFADPEARIIHQFLDRTLDAFVACFCEDGDLLSQWRAYAGHDSAGGYALGFTPPGALPAWAVSAPGGHGLSLRRVRYDPTEQKDQFERLLTALIPVLDADPTSAAHQNAFAKNWVDGIVEAASWCKHPAFREEREWRIVYIRNDDRKPLPVKHRSSGGLVVPYVELEIPAGVGSHPDKLPIAVVNCGPSPEPEVKARGVRSLLSTQPHLSGVSVTGSAAPLRL